MFNIPTKEVIMKVGGKIIDIESDEFSLRHYGSMRVVEVRQKEPNMNEPNPRHVISNSPEYLDLLLSMLGHTDAPYAASAWSLLTRLPFN
jgi:hypothetical protein